MSAEAAAIWVAGIGAWGTIIGGLLELRKRTNGQGPIAGKLDEFRDRVDHRFNTIDERLELMDRRVVRVEQEQIKVAKALKEKDR